MVTKELFREIDEFLRRPRVGIGQFFKPFDESDLKRMYRHPNAKARVGEHIVAKSKFFEVEDLGTVSVAYAEIRTPRSSGRRSIKDLCVFLDEPLRQDLQLHLKFPSIDLELIGEDDNGVSTEGPIYSTFRTITSGELKEPPLDLISEMEVGFF